MSEFSHSIVLFTGDDGLPLEFNVRHTNDKEYLKALIEHGGGFCSHSESAVHLISPDTKVLNCKLGKKLVSSSYIMDCVKKDCLLDVNEYVFTVSEAPTSDISDEDSEKLSMPRQSTCKSPNKRPSPAMNLSPIKSPKLSNETSSTTSNLTLPSSCSALQFKSPNKCPSPAKNLSPIKSPKLSNETSSTTSNLTLPSSCSALRQTTNSSSTHSESFVECSQDVSSNYKIASLVYHGNEFKKVTSPKSKKSPMNLQEPIDVNSQSLVSPQKSNIVATNISCPSSPQDLHTSPVFKDMQYEKSDNDMVLTPPRDIKQWHTNATTIILSPVKPKNIENDLSENVSDYQDKADYYAKVNTEIKLLVQSPVKDNNAMISERDNIDHNESINISPEIQISNNSNKVSGSSQLAAEVIDNPIPASPIEPVVSSSQPEKPDEINAQLDKFDNMLLCKAQIEHKSEDEESLSQSYTVSSSADAQIGSKPCSAEDILSSSHEKNADPLPDSPNLSLSQMNIQDYLQNLELEVTEILQKQSPKTIQDKITLVKYICCVRKLPPRNVLTSLIEHPSQLE